MTLVVALLALLAASPGEDASIEVQLDALDQAWRAGDVLAAAEHAVTALELIEASDCPLRSDAAIAALVGGLASSADGAPGVSGYLFWAAHQINQGLDVLADEPGALARDLRMMPGERISADARYIRSPYRRVETLESDCAPARLDPNLIEAQPSHASVAFMVIRWGSESLSQPWRRAEVIFAYPAEEGRRLEARLHGLERRAQVRGDRTRLLAFDPCIRLQSADLIPVRLCREQAAP